jgi:hypothetical protein
MSVAMTPPFATVTEFFTWLQVDYNPNLANYLAAVKTATQTGGSTVPLTNFLQQNLSVASKQTVVINAVTKRCPDIINAEINREQSADPSISIHSIFTGHTEIYY